MLLSGEGIGKLEDEATSHLILIQIYDHLSTRNGKAHVYTHRHTEIRTHTQTHAYIYIYIYIIKTINRIDSVEEGKLLFA